MKQCLSVISLLLLSFVADPLALADDAKYLIGPGDRIEISVWKDESLSRQIIVPPDGVVSFPLIGETDVTNLTVPGLRKAVKEKLSAYVPDATVTVVILEFNSLKAYVIGKVNRPGEFPITMETTVMQILSMAGGPNPFASLGKISVLRQRKSGSVRIPFDYKEVLDGDNLAQNIVLERGDVIMVP